MRNSRQLHSFVNCGDWPFIQTVRFLSLLSGPHLMTPQFIVETHLGVSLWLNKCACCSKMKWVWRGHWIREFQRFWELWSIFCHFFFRYLAHFIKFLLSCFSPSHQVFLVVWCNWIGEDVSINHFIKISICPLTSGMKATPLDVQQRVVADMWHG